MSAVLTGVGVVSALGLGRERFFAGLRTGECGVRAIQHFDASALPIRVAGEVPVLRPDADWLRAQLPGLGDDQHELLAAAGRAGALRDRKVAFVARAAWEAWQHAGCGPAEQSAAICLALGLEQAFLDDLVAALRPGGSAAPSPAESAADGELALDFLAPHAGPPIRFRSPVDLGARLVAKLLGLRGEVAVNASACAAGGLAVARAAALIRRGQADVVLCGGADSMVNPFSLAGLLRLGAPSPRHTPDACRPFDVRRDGLVVGEGAAVFVVESAARAQARGARILARLAGAGSSQDGYRLTAPRPDGRAAQRAMSQALRRSGLPTAAIGYLNAHGTGTPLGDPAEALAIRATFGTDTDRLPVSSIKGAVGHLMAAAGSLELAACLLALTEGTLPGTAHLQELDPACPLRVLGPAAERAEVAAVMSNSFGFGGQNVSLVLSRGAP
jgi:3-oxoacyl-[acyl-carrier-protein] synthase II